MNLVDLPLDIFVEVARRLTVYDVLSLRQVSRTLNERSRSRTVWYNALCQACIQHGVPCLTSEEVQLYTDLELEYLACRPARFGAAIAAFANERQDGPNDASLPKEIIPGVFPHPHELNLPDGSYTQIHLVKGGRWLVTMLDDGTMRVYDLEPWRIMETSGATTPTAESSTAARARRTSRDMSPCWELHLETCFKQPTTIMDAHLSDDGNELNIFTNIRSPNTGSRDFTVFAVNLSSTDPPEQRILLQVALWARSDWILEKTDLVCFGGDLAVFAKEDIRESAWVWNWRTDASIKVRLEPPAKTTKVHAFKIVGNYLLAVHSEDGRKAVLSMYGIPLSTFAVKRESRSSSVVDMPPPPTFEDGLHFGPEVLATLFTTKFHGVHHVTPQATDMIATRPNRRPTSSGGSRNNIPVFRIQTVHLSDPHWMVPPQPRGQKPFTPWYNSRERGEFRMAVLLESNGDSRDRTKSRILQYVSVDLNHYRDSGVDASTIASRSGMSNQTGKATVAEMEMPTLHLRGRISSDKEVDSLPKQSTIGVDRKNIVSLFGASNGLHAFSGLLAKEKTVSPSSPQPLPPPRLPVISRRERAQVPLGRELPQTKSPTPDTYPKTGLDVVIYPWQETRTVNGPSRERSEIDQFVQMMAGSTTFKPSEALVMTALPMYQHLNPNIVRPPPGRRTLGTRLSVSGDTFSGRVVVLDEMDGHVRSTVVRILVYV